MRRIEVDVIGEESLEDFKATLQLRADRGWIIRSHSVVDFRESCFWYTAVLTRIVSESG